MELGIVKPIGIVDQMTGAYLDYSMSVIVSRALPDVRDGLKPVHRRVLYAMDQMGLQANRSFRKSAGVVGEVLKEYHPHGDASVYDTMVRLVQPWAMRSPLALGQGNWVHRDQDVGDRIGVAGGHRQGHRRLQGKLRRSQHRAGRAARAAAQSIA